MLEASEVFVGGEDPRGRALAACLARYARFGITGGPDCGQTTLAERVTDRPVVHTDTWKLEAWADQPAHVIAACAELERFVLEGVQVARSVRRGLNLEAILFLGEAHGTRTARQDGMTKGIVTVIASLKNKVPIILVS